MNKKENIDKLIDEIIDSADDTQRATPGPFLLTRVNARLNKTRENVWEKAIRVVGRPAIAVPGLAMLILVNLGVILFNRPAPFASATEQLSQGDDFTYTAATIYDIENTEP